MRKYLCVVVLACLLTACGSVNQEYAQTLANYAQGLSDAGVEPFGQVSLDGQPIIVLLTPTTGEVSAQRRQEILDLVSVTAQVFGVSGGLRHEDILIAFRPPVLQQIVVIDRPEGMPEPIGMLSEASIGSQPGQIMSVVNLSGTEKTLGRDFTITWAVMQAVCLGYAVQDNPNADAMCNIIAANAAAGWAGVDRGVIQDFLDGGSTGLEYLGERDYEFRFIDFVYEAFLKHGQDAK